MAHALVFLVSLASYDEFPNNDPDKSHILECLEQFKCVFWVRVCAAGSQGVAAAAGPTVPPMPWFAVWMHCRAVLLMEQFRTQKILLLLNKQDLFKVIQKQHA